MEEANIILYLLCYDMGKFDLYDSLAQHVCVLWKDEVMILAIKVGHLLLLSQQSHCLVPLACHLFCSCTSHVA